jgi:ubiquinol-cytochrome c reductase iron-sulfur subunit
LIVVGAGAAGTALGVALITPAASLGPVFHMAPFFRTPWRRGRLLVDEDGKPFLASDVEEETFYTAFPQDADREQIGAPLVVVRLPLSQLDLPAGRKDWAPHGIVAYSKICTHAGCAIALYRKPTFPPTEPRPALVCPCHYSTFDPARGGHVIFGPAGRPLPQLPLLVDASGRLRAAGNFSGAVGPSWWGVRNRKPHS